ncbi:helix-turn-helix domain-containing protein [Leptospira sarikeiensis]|uniref:XRE family transcriptional regulator n=1 Tax=Leptospira sarikeiensis TaxID=2484943 RepID=A0A4R9K971_9LEPT|nr:helix-turn-helix transcriptional regulator [Leptospira sarikeiensis]TGL62056.1 XRE family transcriptional regulator [Leptospira sarikeiensis]
MSNSFGQVLRILRDSKKKSQLDLALDAGISTKHLSFLESGRAKPGKEIVRKLSDALEISSPYQNVLFVAAGFSSEIPSETKEPRVDKEILKKMILNQDPNPACAVDPNGKIIVSNLGMNCLVSELNGMFSVVEGMSRNELILSENGLGPYLLDYGVFADRMSNCRIFEELVIDQSSRRSNEIQKEDLKELPKIRLKYQGVLSFDVLETVIGHPFDIHLGSIRCYYMIPSDENTKNTMISIVENFKLLPSRFARGSF